MTALLPGVTRRNDERILIRRSGTSETAVDEPEVRGSGSALREKLLEKIFFSGNKS